MPALPNVKLKPLPFLLLVLPAAAAAQDSAGNAAIETHHLPEVVVKATLNNEDLIGRTIGYTILSSDAVSKSKQPLNETAQSVSVVSRQQIEDQRPASLSEALNYSAGAFSGLVGAARRYDYVAIRGFNDNMTDNVLIDGQRLLSDSNTYSSMQIDPYFIEHIDLVKGPVSSAYGRASPGGVVAATTKRPLHEEYREINVFGGNRKQAGISADITGNFDKDGKLSYRLTALGKRSDSQNDGHESQRYAVAPSLSWHISPSTNLLLQAYVQNDPDGGYHSGLPAEGMISSRNGFRFERSFSDSEPTDRFRRRQNIYSYQFNHAFGNDWQFTSKLRYADVRTHNRQTWHTGWIAPTTLYRAGGDAHDHLRSYAFDNAVKGRIQTGAVEHTLIAGSDYQRRTTDSLAAYDYATVSPLDVLNPQYDNRAYAYNDYPSHKRYRLSQIGFYVRDDMKWQNWRASAAVRHDRVDTSATDLESGAVSSRYKGGKTTRSTSLLYAFNNGLSPYLSYSTGFNPNTYNDTNGNLLKPTESRQLEAGLKYQPAGTQHLLSLAAYDLRQKNVANRVINGNYYIPSGEVHSKGVEAEGRFQIGRKWFVQAAAVYNKAEFKNNTAGLDGKTPYQSPKFTAALWTNYQFDNGLAVNGGVRHVRGIWADHANTVKVPAATLADVGVRYHFGKLNSGLSGLYGSLSVNNVFNKKYVASCAGLDYCYYGEGRNVLGNLSYRW